MFAWVFLDSSCALRSFEIISDGNDRSKIIKLSEQDGASLSPYLASKQPNNSSVRKVQYRLSLLYFLRFWQFLVSANFQNLCCIWFCTYKGVSMTYKDVLPKCPLQANNARKRFLSPDGDHITYINVLRLYIQEAKDRGGGERDSHNSTSKNKNADKHMRNWCTSNFINGRSLRRAADIQQWVVFSEKANGLT